MVDVLGGPLGLQKEYDLSNAVATFGTFHHWHQDDVLKDRTLVFASFPSPALVPRDVVFSRYGDLGAVRESWTAACYILTADFAEIMPADEDPMPFDGNPHPMPGGLVQQDNMFVLPPFPELGWNEGPEQVIEEPQFPVQQPQEQNIQVEEEIVEPPVVIAVNDSIVLHPSADSVESGQGDNALEVDQPLQGEAQLQMVQFHQEQEHGPIPQENNVMHVGFVFPVVFGPVLPPAMRWNNAISFILPALLAKEGPKPSLAFPMTRHKRSADDAFELEDFSAIF